MGAQGKHDAEKIGTGMKPRQQERTGQEGSRFGGEWDLLFPTEPAVGGPPTVLVKRTYMGESCCERGSPPISEGKSLGPKTASLQRGRGGTLKKSKGGEKGGSEGQSS